MNRIALALKRKAELGDKTLLDEFVGKLNSMSYQEISALCKVSVAPLVDSYFRELIEDSDEVDFNLSDIEKHVKDEAHDYFWTALCDLDGELGTMFDEVIQQYGNGGTLNDEAFNYLFSNVWDDNWVECCSDGNADLEGFAEEKSYDNKERANQERQELQQQWNATSPDKR